jgi:hypothetical protein
MHWDPEATRIVLTIAVIIAFGIPTIMKTIWLPRQLKCKEVPPEQFTPKQAACFAEYDRKMAGIGFTPFSTFTAMALPNPNINRMYASPADPARCDVMVIGVKQSSTINVEFVTRFADGTRLSTKNSEFSSVFAPFPKRITQTFPGVTDPAIVKSYHDRRSETLRDRMPEFRPISSAFADLEDYHQRFCEHQVSKNLLRFDAENGIYRTTYGTALRGIANFLNPMADNFTLGRFCLGTLLGAGLPLGAVTQHARIVLWLAAWMPTQLTLANTFLLPVACTLAGSAVGAIFTRKSFIWAILLGYLPAKFLTVSGLTFGLSLYMAVIAHWTAHLLLARRKLV